MGLLWQILISLPYMTAAPGWLWRRGEHAAEGAVGQHDGAGRGDGLEHRGWRLEGRLRGEVPAGLHPQEDHEQVEWRQCYLQRLLTHLIVVGRLWTLSSFLERMHSASQLLAAGGSEEDSEAIEVMSSSRHNNMESSSWKGHFALQHN